MTRLAPMVEQNGLRVHVPPGVIFWHDQYVAAPPASARMLRVLMCAEGAPVSAMDLLDCVHPHTSMMNLWPHVSRLRKALKVAGAPIDILLEGRADVVMKWSNQ